MAVGYLGDGYDLRTFQTRYHKRLKAIKWNTDSFWFLCQWQFICQTKIRLGDGTYSSNKVLTIDGVKVRLGNGTYSSNKVLYTFDRNSETGWWSLFIQ
jgi:hypothetical protein